MISATLKREVRRAVYKREGWACALCDSPKYLQVHHIIKRSQGGSNHPHNLICLCSDCHALAHGMDLRGVMPSIGTPGFWATDYAPKVDDLLDIERDRTIDQAIVEYMADHYACQGIVWSPWLKEGAKPMVHNGRR